MRIVAIYIVLVENIVRSIHSCYTQINITLSRVEIINSLSLVTLYYIPFEIKIYFLAFIYC